MAQNIDEFPTIRQYFPYQKFTLSHIPVMNLWRSDPKYNYISEAPLKVAFFTVTAQLRIATVPNFLFTVENLVYWCILSRDQSILLLFSPIFLSSNSFFPTYYACYFAHHQLICSKV